ncbi:class I SAM-dependent methyltransferase [Nocardioides lianchengensis]|uniref:Methyltransferase domain-containing protein n=1 Tax=Nocardioides lianchengensis TaxID=1045774 RepID=A0A1G6PHW7_9ACTN|nr:class I SAM-dependent methyltransferase [Nocardioides lianchengensis]NYG11840.1 SAM-dependent methyltransferase [Nocardioides lianchengensis]SDC79007.1 Methyltransferase domain-containing protein [Nocardioides lianchengensis]
MTGVSRSGSGARGVSPGARPSPNIWHHTATYEIENRAVDPDGLLEAAMAAQASWAGRTVLDVGCGTGFHLPRFAEAAASVVGVEPHHDLVAIARRRTKRLRHVSVLQGTAQDLPLPDASVDVVHARWAYFFGPGCEPGLAELDRVVRRGGTAFVIDNDPTRSTFGGWFRRSFPEVDPEAVQRFWTGRGWRRTPVEMRWSFSSRADLEAVVRIELTPDVAEAALAGHEGTEVDYAVNVWSKDY